MRNRAGITQRYPTGKDEVEYSDVAKTESGRGCGLGRGGYREGNVFASSPGTWDNEEFYRVKKSENTSLTRRTSERPSSGNPHKEILLFSW